MRSFPFRKPSAARARAALLIVASLFVAGCASKTPETDASPVALRPLEKMAGQEIVLFPVQYLSATDTLGWQQQIPNRAAFLAGLDDQIEAEFTRRGLGQTWTFGREIERASKLNSTLMTDARSLSAEWMRGRIRAQTPVHDPLASQVRGLVGLKGQRYAILPVEMRLANLGPGTGVAILRIVVIDSRMAQIHSVIEVASDPVRALSPAVTANLAKHLADLVVAP